MGAAKRRLKKLDRAHWVLALYCRFQGHDTDDCCCERCERCTK